jgi:type IV pilus assembly protein PilY1
MKWIKTLSFLIPFLCLLLPMVSFARDTDIYMASGEGVEPNILIIFDNSGSMNNVLYTIRYDRTVTYDPLAVPIANRDVVYKYNSLTRTWVLFGTTVANSQISNVPCPTAQNALTTSGQYTGKTGYSSSKCANPSLQLRTGNYLNYQAAGGDQNITKLDVAKDTIKDLIDTVNGVKIGLMVFNNSVSDYTAHGGGGWFGSNSHGGRIQSGIVSLTDSNKVTLKTQIDAITASTWTPLAETLYEAGLYFKGGASYFNSGVTYVSPIEYSCQKNYIIIMTDGDPTRDDGYRPGDSEPSTSDPEAHDHILKTGIGGLDGDRDGDGREPGGANRVHYFVEETDMLGTDYLDDVAKYLYDSDLRGDLTGKQNIITYTIGFAVTPQQDLLGRTARLTGGKYYQASSAGELADAFQHIVGEVLEETSSFVAPIVPVSRMESSSGGDKIYLALFQPNKNSMWSGNIKRFGVAQNNSPLNCNDIDIPCTYHIGDILDLSGSPALDGGIISSGADSHWPTEIDDGPNVEKGGVGGILKNRSTVRNIYTYLGTSSNLADSSNAFTLANTSITPSLFGLLSSDNTGRDNLINFVHGYDAYDEDGDGNFTEKRNWILGAFLHSRPLIVHYASQSVIFAGANDGMLHVFNDDTGEELWGFIPPNLLNKLQALRTDVNASFVDGSPKAYIARNADGSINRVILIFGQRRGGNRYYALDVTNPSSPQYLWEINPDASGSLYAEIGVTDPTTGRTGQTWSFPNIGKIAYGTEEKWVVFIGGGYDDNQDNDPVTVPDLKGRALYVVDVLNGSLIKRFSHAEMTYSIPSDVAKVDIDGDGKIDRLYVGDMGGQMWRFDISDPNPTNWTAMKIFESNPGSDSTTGRKIFYPPDVTLEKGNYEMLFFGTGDRENPKEETVINRLYDIKDKSDGRTLTESNLYDVTSDELQESGTTAQRKSDILAALNLADGWLIKLYPGEKSLSAPVLFYKTAYFTTFSPIATADPCDARFGTARMYALDYTTGNAVFNLDLTNDSGGKKVERSDRSEVIGTAIPSGVIITFLQGTGVAYTGVGGGVDMPPLPNTKSLVPIYWRIVF